MTVSAPQLAGKPDAISQQRAKGIVFLGNWTGPILPLSLLQWQGWRRNLSSQNLRPCRSFLGRRVTLPSKPKLWLHLKARLPKSKDVKVRMANLSLLAQYFPSLCTESLTSWEPLGSPAKLDSRHPDQSRNQEKLFSPKYSLKFRKPKPHISPVPWKPGGPQTVTITLQTGLHCCLPQGDVTSNRATRRHRGHSPSAGSPFPPRAAEQVLGDRGAW